MNWKTEIWFNTCRNGSNHMPDAVANCRDSGAQLPEFKWWLYHVLPGFGRLLSKLSGPNCCLSNELLVLGESAFLGHHICTRRELFKGHVWRVGPAVGKTVWRLGSLKGCSRRSEGKRLNKTGSHEPGLASSQCISHY